MSQFLLGTINKGFGCIFQREKQVSIPLGTINTAVDNLPTSVAGVFQFL